MAELRAIKLGPELLEGDLIWRRRTRAKTWEGVARESLGPGKPGTWKAWDRNSLGPGKQGALAWRRSPRERPSNTTREGPPSTGRTHFRNLQGPPLKGGGQAHTELASPGPTCGLRGTPPAGSAGSPCGSWGCSTSPGRHSCKRGWSAGGARTWASPFEPPTTCRAALAAIQLVGRCPGGRSKAGAALAPI